MEATMGAVAYHRPTDEAIRTAGYLCGDPPAKVNTVLASHVRGYQPQSIYKHLSDNRVLTEMEMVLVKTLERAQKSGIPIILHY